ncbi:MAG: xylulokinase [Planctomycetota bacterium]|nr:xylulokinase [Planctomycetota bacterium]MDA1106097.1 xylulokinase [Planctomycetota bacterium]
MPDGCGATACCLGLDVGTQGVKALLIDADSGAVIARGSAPLSLMEGLPPGHAEQHPSDWAAAIRSAIAEVWREVPKACESLLSVGVSGQQHGAVVLDEHLQVIRPAKLWCDTSTAREAAELSATLQRPIPAGFTAPKLLWLKRHEPSNWARVRHVLLPHDWVNLQLTGAIATEAGDASGTGYFDPVKRDWDGAALAAIDPRAHDLVPPLAAPGSIIGRVNALGADLLGLHPSAIGRVAVSTGGGDNMMSAIGAGATTPGPVVISLGTSATVFTVSDRPIIDPSGAIAPFCDSTGKWLPLICMLNCTGVLEEVRLTFGMDHAQLTQLARAVPQGCNGLAFTPYLRGERVPNLPNATGTLTGIRDGLLRPGHLYRAALEGVTASISSAVGRLMEFGLTATTIRLVGGGSKNALWQELISAAIGAPVEPLAEPETAALGAALQARLISR